jgi:hypothetical protein
VSYIPKPKIITIIPKPKLLYNNIEKQYSAFQSFQSSELLFDTLSNIFMQIINKLKLKDRYYAFQKKQKGTAGRLKDSNIYNNIYNDNIYNHLILSVFKITFVKLSDTLAHDQ